MVGGGMPAATHSSLSLKVSPILPVTSLGSVVNVGVPARMDG